MNTATFSTPFDQSLGLRLFCALAMSMTLVACDEERPEVARSTTIILEDADPVATTSATTRSPSSPENSASGEKLDAIDAVLAHSIEEETEIEVPGYDSPQELSDAQLDGIVSDALETEEGRDILAPLFEREMLQREAAKQARASSPEPSRVVVSVRQEKEDRERDETRPTPGYYYGAGFVGNGAPQVFVDPNGRTVSVDGQPLSQGARVNGSVIQPTAFGIAPTYFNGTPANSATGTSVNGTPLVSQIPPRSSLPAQTPANMPSQIPARSALPSQVPANAGAIGGAPAVGPAVSGPGVAGF